MCMFEYCYLYYFIFAKGDKSPTSVRSTLPVTLKLFLDTIQVVVFHLFEKTPTRGLIVIAIKLLFLFKLDCLCHWGLEGGLKLN